LRTRVLAAGAWLACAALLFAQEYRATLVGAITDQSGAAVPGVRINLVNLETGVSVASAANEQGRYVVPYLLPGRYKLELEQAGFRAFERSPIELRINDRVEINVVLELGQVSDRVTVVAEAPLLETTTSSRGQVIDNRKITDLPLNGRNPFELVNIAAGVQYSGSSLTYFRPFDNGSINDFSINGGQHSMNEIQLDGVPNNAIANYGSVQQVAYVPPVEATQEFKIQTNTYDAQYGRTGGGVVSLSIKPGTNRLHGAAYEYMRRSRFEANQYSNNATGQPRPGGFVDQYGFELDGPITVPKVYRGKDRSFFMFSAEKYRDFQPQPAQGSVPTAEQRAGDFSQTMTTANKPYTLYDPLTVTANPAFDKSKAVSLTNAQYLRTPFAGNRIPQDRTVPVALAVLKDIPLPNQTGDAITHANNYFAGQAGSLTDYYNVITRIDHTINDRWRMYGRWDRNFRDGGRKNPYDWDTNAKQISHASRRNDGGVVDVVGVLNQSTILSGRVGFNRFVYTSIYEPQDLSYLGLPVTSLLQLPGKYPIFNFENYINTSIDEKDVLPSETWTAQGSVLKNAGSHSIKAGAEYRVQHFASFGRKNGGGSYSFTRGWTSVNPQVDDKATGNAIASFLLGYMSDGSATLNATPYTTWHYPVLFFQDDWQVNRRLTLNLGLRWDYETPPVERYDRQNRGFDASATSPYNVAGLDLKGGLLFAGTGGNPRGAFDPDRNTWQPRVGLAYKVLRSKALVFRGGVGRYFLPTSDFGGSLGFSRVTSVQSATADYKPFNTMLNPFPGGLLQPAGAQGGLATQVGDAAAFFDPQRRIPYVWQFSAGFQYEIKPGLVVDASYVGSRTRRLQVSKDIDVLTAEQLALGTPYLSQAVTNPFYGVLPSNTSRGAQSTIQRRNLLLPYPQFTSLMEGALSQGSSWYNSFQFKVEKRFGRGLSVLVSYTASKTMQATEFLNPQDAQPSRELTDFDVPQRLMITGNYELPVGHGKKWLSHGIASHIIGGWELNWLSTLQRGIPVSYSGAYYIYGDPKLSSGQTLNHWLDTSPSIWVVRPPDTLRTSKMRSSTIRTHSAPQADLTLIRNFHIREGHRFQFKASAFNATNTPIFSAPNTTPSSNVFGVVPITQRNLPRSVELGFRYAF
jgi:hypothetical protein